MTDLGITCNGKTSERDKRKKKKEKRAKIKRGERGWGEKRRGICVEGPVLEMENYLIMQRQDESHRKKREYERRKSKGGRGVPK